MAILLIGGSILSDMRSAAQGWFYSISKDFFLILFRNNFLFNCLKCKVFDVKNGIQSPWQSISQKHKFLSDDRDRR
jgi:hypothetical protein